MVEATGLPPQLEAALAQWANTVPCRLLIVFGSAAAKRAQKGSDIDLAVAFDNLPDPERRLQIIGELQDLCGSRRVDVTFLRRVSDAVLRFEIFRGGYAIHEARPGIFASEAVRALALYEDALPFRRMLREHIARRSGQP